MRRFARGLTRGPARTPTRATSCRASLARRVGLAILLACTGTANAQDEAVRTTARFHTADGSHILLVKDLTVHQVHWAIASWIDGRDDPRGLEGLASATMRTSLAGTWQLGSRDREAERTAVARLSEAEQRVANDRDNKQLQQQILALRAQAATFGDPRTYRRVLAATPTHRPEVREDGPLATLVLTTVESAIPDVALLLRQRREDLAMRGLSGVWAALLKERLALRKQQRGMQLHIELLALMMPLTPKERMLWWPRMHRYPTPEQAIDCWQASQHPKNTMHVLIGNFDLDSVRTTLKETFASTTLPPPENRAPQPPRPLRTERRSLVHGFRGQRYAIAWTLQYAQQQGTAEIMTNWFAGGERSYLARQLRTRGFPDARIVCRAPWPIVRGGASLMLLDVTDPTNKPGLLEAILGACEQAQNCKIGDGQVYVANMQRQQDWNRSAGDPRQVAANLARQALLWPKDTDEVGAPRRVTGKDVQDMLRKTLATNPAIAEGRK